MLEACKGALVDSIRDSFDERKITFGVLQGIDEDRLVTLDLRRITAPFFGEFFRENEVGPQPGIDR